MYKTDSVSKRPWGWFIKLIHLKRLWIKLLFVKGRTSLQTHEHRDEYFLGFFKIKKGEEHRLTHGIFLEVATGKPIEDDIIRLKDDYGR